MGGRNFPQHSEAKIFQHEVGRSFVCVGESRSEEDSFSHFITTFVTNVLDRFEFTRRLGRVVDDEIGLVSYDDSKIEYATRIITTVMASIVPAISILILYVLKNTYARIGLTALLSSVFALLLATCSSAKKVEIFAVTAAYVSSY